MAREDDEVEDRPRRRRSKRGSKNKKLMMLAVIGIGSCVLMAVVGIVAVILVLTRTGSAKMTTPTAYVAYDSPEEVFHIELPKDWVITYGGAKKNFYWATAEKGGASIKIYESLIGSLIGDIADAGTPDPNVDDERLPVSRVHEFKQKLFAEDYSSFREEPAVTVESKMGKVRKSEFTARAELGRKVKGYRATALGAMTQLTIVCTCSPGDWDVVEPAFARAIESVGRGQGGKPLRDVK